MGVQDRMVKDVSRVFLHAKYFAESILYTPAGGTTRSIKALVEYGEDLEAITTEDGQVVRRMRAIRIATNDSIGVAQPRRGDTVRKASESIAYVVVGRPEWDSGGFQHLKLERVATHERSHREHRIRR